MATVAIESRGHGHRRAQEAAHAAERIARRLNDPRLLAFTLNGRFMQTFQRAGLAPQRDALGQELVALSTRHGLHSFEVLGHLIRLQALSALQDFDRADAHAATLDQLTDHQRPLVTVFTRWYRALRLSATNRAGPASEENAYAEAAERLTDAGMPGLARGLPALARLSVRLRHDRPIPTGETDWGPYEPWVRPLALVAQDRVRDARAALRSAADPPSDLMLETMWCLIARAALAVRDADMIRRAHEELAPAAAELAGAGSGLLTLGPVSDHVTALQTAMARDP